jgi:hypothetical protein
MYAPAVPPCRQHCEGSTCTSYCCLSSLVYNNASDLPTGRSSRMGSICSLNVNPPDEKRSIIENTYLIASAAYRVKPEELWNIFASFRTTARHGCKHDYAVDKQCKLVPEADLGGKCPQECFTRYPGVIHPLNQRFKLTRTACVLSAEVWGFSGELCNYFCLFVPCRFLSFCSRYLQVSFELQPPLIPT